MKQYRDIFPGLQAILKRVGFAVLFLGGIVLAGPITVNAPSNTYFIANEGQWEGDFSFKCEVGSAVYYVTPKGLTVDFREFKRYPRPRDPGNPMDMMDRHEDRDSLTVRGHVVQIHYNGANKNLTSMGEGKLAHYSNYFLGRDSTKWRSRVSHYQTILVPEVWPGIDVEYRADHQGVETVYYVKPGADPAQIQMEYLGLDAPLRIDAQGNLVLTTSLGEMKEQAPFAFQQVSRMQERVESSYRVVDDNRVGFELDGYNSTMELVVDPLLYGTYLGGGAEDECHVVCPAPDGGVYVAGSTDAMSGFPTTPGAYDETGLFPGHRHFCCHFGPDGEFIASTLLGEIQTSEDPHSNAGFVDMVYDSARGGLWMVGGAYDDGWPLTPDAYDTVIDEFGDGIMVRLSSDLTDLSYCSYLGGNGNDGISALEIGTDGILYAAGKTYSTDFPTTPDAFSSVRQESDCFIWMYDIDAHEVEFSTYFGGSDQEYWTDGFQFDNSGTLWLLARTQSVDLPVTDNAFQSVCGDSSGWGDMMLAGFTFAPPTIEYCSYLGGVDTDMPNALAVKDSVLYVAGWTYSINFPVSTDAYDTSGPNGLTTKAFISAIIPEHNIFIGTFFGGTRYEQFALNTNWVHDSTVTLVGTTDSDDLPVTNDCYQAGLRGSSDGFVVKFDLGLTELLYCSYVGGGHYEMYRAVSVSNPDCLWMVGKTLSVDFPTTPNAIQPGDNGLSSGFVQHFAIDTTADTTSAAGHRPIPSDIAMRSYPNPFNPTTTLTFTLPRSTDVEIRVRNVLGQEIERIDLGHLSAGQHRQRVGTTAWATGLYFATLSAGSGYKTTKLLLLR
ncbi:MAG: T9SS type A sorting domain-containing protein [bacterium]|nr:T9SS type A sorting domain-containing protein [bacterium]